MPTPPEQPGYPPRPIAGDSGRSLRAGALAAGSDRRDPRAPEQPGTGERLVDAATHARQHSTVRKAHETELIEDYVELIADLIAANGEARAVDLAQRLDVAQATVAKMIRRLREAGLAVSQPYRSIFLTAEGERVAAAARERHLVVLQFLLALGVSEANARQDAEGVEHHVSDETLALMRDFVGARTGDADAPGR